MDIEIGIVTFAALFLCNLEARHPLCSAALYPPVLDRLLRYTILVLSCCAFPLCKFNCTPTKNLFSRGQDVLPSSSQSLTAFLAALSK